MIQYAILGFIGLCSFAIFLWILDRCGIVSAIARSISFFFKSSYRLTMALLPLVFLMLLDTYMFLLVSQNMLKFFGIYDYSTDSLKGYTPSRQQCIQLYGKNLLFN